MEAQPNQVCLRCTFRIAPGLHGWMLTFLSLTTKMAQTATVTKMLVGTYKRRRRVHTSGNGTRGHLG
jgi:hypothetical protein